MTEKLVELWKREDYCHPFREPENILHGIYTEEAANKYLEGKRIVDPHGGAIGYFTRPCTINR